MSDHCHRNYVSDASKELLAKRRAALDELTRISQEMGLYDEDFDNILIKRPVSPSVIGQVESSLPAPPSAIPPQ
jgi:hypothetical protein